MKIRFVSLTRVFLWILALLPLNFAIGEVSNGLAPEVPGLNTKDNLYALEFKLPDLEKPYINAAPDDKKDGLIVGAIGVDGGNRAMVESYATELANVCKDEKAGNVDSLLISYKGKLIFESYFRRGRANFPHYQMSITKSYTALAVGRAIQLGLLKMEDLDKPVISFFKKLDTTKLAPGSESITLTQSMQMTSGIKLDESKATELIGSDKVKAAIKTSIKKQVEFNAVIGALQKKNPDQFKGQGEIQTYLQYSAPIPPAPRGFDYKEADPATAMQVVDAVAPSGAKDFILKELLTPLNITQYQWEKSVSGVPKSAAGSAILSRDMVKFGQLIINKGKWKGQQLIPEAYIAKATMPGPVNANYGFFWWVDESKVGDKIYHSIQGRGAGGQFIFIFPELDLVAVVTSHDKGMGNMMQTLPQRVIPAFASSK